MIRRACEELEGIVHIEKPIKAPVGRVYRAFQKARALRIWYDPRCSIDKFSVGGKLVGDNYPSAEILALVPNHTIVHRYSDIVSGLGIWSFVEKAGGKTTSLLFDHIDASENAEERDSIGRALSRILRHIVRVASYHLTMTPEATGRTRKSECPFHRRRI